MNEPEYVDADILIVGGGSAGLWPQGGGISEPSLKQLKGHNDFEEIERCIEPGDAKQEAWRCYSRREPFGKYRTCWFCPPCEVECPHDALWVEMPYLLR